MVKKIKTKAPAKKDLIDDTQTLEEATTVEVEDVELSSLTMKDQLWRLKIVVGGRLENTHRAYRILLTLNEKPLLETIERIKGDLDSGLFKDDKTAQRNAAKSIEKHEGVLASQRKDCTPIEFLGFTQEMKQTDKGTVLVLQVPDDAIEPINKQKGRTKLYKIALTPQLL